MKKLIEPIRIEIPLGIMFQTVNCYLVPGEQLTLIDCGLFTPENWNILQEKIKSHGYQLSDIEQVIITHEHRDHIGMLPELMQHCKATIRIPKAIEQWFSQPNKVEEEQLEFTKNLFQTLGFPDDILKQVFSYFEIIPRNRPIENTERLHFYEAGQTLNIGNSSWEILNTPGHCPNQFVFIQKAQQRIFASDMLLPIAPMPIIVEHPEKKGQSIKALPELLNSFARLQAFNFETIYPGHGNTFTNGNQVIEKQLSRIQMRKEECYEAIKSGLTTPFQINRKMYPYQLMPPDFSGMYMVLGYIDLLEEEGRIVKTNSQLLELKCSYS